MAFPVTAGGVRQKLQRFDWSLIKGSTVLSAGSMAARGLAMVFWLVLARAFTPAAYGQIQYDITLGMLVAVLTHPFGQYVLARYVAKHQGDPEQLHTVISNIAVFTVGLSALTLAVAVPLLMALGKFNSSIVVVFVGITLFYAYWGLASGLGASVRLTLAYFASNLMQLLVAAGAIYLLQIVSGELMTAVYGASYFIPLLLIQLFSPLKASVSPRRVQRAVLVELAQFSWPVWLSHIGFTVLVSAPVLLLEHFTGDAAVGVFALGSTLTAVFTIVNSSVATVLLPKLTVLEPQQRARLFRKVLIGLIGLNSVFLAVYVATIGWIIQTFFGPEYAGATATYIVLGIAQIFNGMTVLMTAVLVGGGRVRLEAIGRLMSPLVCIGGGLLLVPLYAELGAAIAMMAGAAAPLVVYATLGRRSPPSDAPAIPDQPARRRAMRVRRRVVRRPA